MISVHNVIYVLKCINDIFKQQIRRSFGLSQSGNLKEESSSGVGKAPSAASVRKCLAGESSAEQVEVRQVCGVNLGCVRIVSFLLSRFVDCLVAGIGVFVDLAVSYTPETARAGQPGAETANAGEHIKISDQVISSPSCRASKKPRTLSSTSPAPPLSCASSLVSCAPRSSCRMV